MAPERVTEVVEIKKPTGFVQKVVISGGKTSILIIIALNLYGI